MDENNPIEGLDPSQSAFEPLMDQTMPEGVQGMRTTTTTTMYISGAPLTPQEPMPVIGQGLKDIYDQLTPKHAYNQSDLKLRVQQILQDNNLLNTSKEVYQDENKLRKVRDILAIEDPTGEWRDERFDDKINLTKRFPDLFPKYSEYTSGVEEGTIIKGITPDTFINKGIMDAYGQKTFSYLWDASGYGSENVDAYGKSIAYAKNIQKAVENEDIKLLKQLGDPDKIAEQYPNLKAGIEYVAVKDALKKDLSKMEPLQRLEYLNNLKEKYPGKKGIIQDKIDETISFSKQLRDLYDSDANDWVSAQEFNKRSDVQGNFGSQDYRYDQDETNNLFGRTKKDIFLSSSDNWNRPMSYVEDSWQEHKYKYTNMDHAFDPLYKDVPAYAKSDYFKIESSDNPEQTAEDLKKLRDSQEEVLEQIIKYSDKGLSLDELTEAYIYDYGKDHLFHPYNGEMKAEMIEIDQQLFDLSTSIISSKPLFTLSNETYYRNGTTKERAQFRNDIILEYADRPQDIMSKSYSEEERNKMYEVALGRYEEYFGEEEIDLFYYITGATSADQMNSEHVLKGQISNNPEIKNAIVVNDEDATVRNLNRLFSGTDFKFRVSDEGSGYDAIEIYTDVDGFELLSSGAIFIDDEKKYTDIVSWMATAIPRKNDKKIIKDYYSNINDLYGEQKRKADFEFTMYALENIDRFDIGGRGAAINLQDAKMFTKDILENSFIPKEKINLFNALLNNAQHVDYLRESKQEAGFLDVLKQDFVGGFYQALDFSRNLVEDIQITFGDQPPELTYGRYLYRKDGTKRPVAQAQDMWVKDRKRKFAEDSEFITQSASGSKVKEAWLETNAPVYIQAASFFVESLGVSASVGGPFGSGTAGMAGFFMYGVNGLEEQMLSEDFDNLTEWEKKMISWPYGIVIGALEKLGFEGSVGAYSNGTFGKISRRFIQEALTDIPENASREVIETAIRNSVKARFLDGSIKFVAGGISEGFVEGTQEVFDVSAKTLINKILEVDQFKDVAEMDLTTVDGWIKLKEQVGEAAWLGMLGGGYGSGGSVALGSIRSGYVNIKSNKEFKEFYTNISNEELLETQKMHVLMRFQSEQISKEQANAEIDALDKMYSISQEIPTDLNTNQTHQAFDLLSEKRKIQEDIEGKQENLVKEQKERLKDIDRQLELISKGEYKDAIQEQETDEKVLPAKGPEVGLQEVDLQEVTITEQATEEEALNSIQEENKVREKNNATPIPETGQEISKRKEELSQEKQTLKEQGEASIQETKRKEKIKKRKEEEAKQDPYKQAVEKIEEKKREIKPETSSNYANLTEDDEGNVVIYHIGPSPDNMDKDEKGNVVIKPASGKTKATSREERGALSKVGGMGMYYTQESDGESMVTGDAKYTVKVPKSKVYDFNSDPEGFIEEARRRHEKEYPGMAFDANTQLAYVSQVASENGYDVVVSEWDGRTRAQSVKELTVSDTQITEGNRVTQEFENTYKSNKDKGYESVIPADKDDQLEDVYMKIKNEKGDNKEYDKTYFLFDSRSRKKNYNQEQITKMVNESNVSQEIKDEYNAIMEAKPEQRRSEKVRDNIAGVDIKYPTAQEEQQRKEERTKPEYVDDAANKNQTEDVESFQKELEGEFGMLTGENPLGKPLTEQENQQLNKKAEEWLKKKGYKPRRVIGKYGQAENSFFVPGLTKEDAIAFANEFNQESVAHSDGMIFQDGTMNPRDTSKDKFNIDEYTPESDMVSVIKTEDGLKTFSVGYDFESVAEAIPKPKPKESPAKKMKQRVDRIMKQVDNAKKAISKIIPDVEIITHKDEASYRKATGETDSKKQTSRGEYNPKTKKIHINLSKANNRTVAHEVFHAILLNKLNTDKAAKDLTERMIKSLSKNLEGMPEVKKALDEFAANYDENIQSEEKLAELVGILAENYGQLSKTNKSLIKRFLDRLAKMFGLKPFTDNEVVDVLNTIAGKVAVGEEIADVDIKVIASPTDSKGNLKTPSKNSQNNLKQRKQNIIDGVKDQVVSGKTVSTSLPNKDNVHSSKDYVVGMSSLEEMANTDKRAKDQYIKIAKEAASYGISKTKDVNNFEDAKKVISEVKEVVKSNLRWLHDSVDKDVRDISKLWYDGANKISNDLANEYGYTTEQVSGVMAVLSPQMDWFRNLSLGERVIDIYKNNQNSLFDEKMIEFVNTKTTGTGKNKKPLFKNKEEIISRVKNKKLSELNPKDQSYFIRVYDEVYNSRNYNNITPNGEINGLVRTKSGNPGKVGWGNFPTIEKAISILNDGSVKNISINLGNEHKVRNFFNNISNPNDKNAVTIDTHAVAAALLKPLSGKSKQVAYNFGGSSAVSTGMTGTYPVYADAYRELANELGILPREVQSITWEAGRGLFKAAFKSNKSNEQKIDNVWNQYESGSISLKEAQSKIDKLAGGISTPVWYEYLANENVESLDKNSAALDQAALDEEVSIDDQATTPSKRKQVVGENEIIFDKVPPKKVLSSILRSLQGKRRSDNIQFDDNVVDIFSDYVKGNEVNINAENYPLQLQEALEGDDMTYGEIANMLRIAGLYETNAAALKGISEIGKVAGVDMMRQVQEDTPSKRKQIVEHIENPKVVISGATDGFQVISKKNVDTRQAQSVKDARADKRFDKDGFREIKLEDGSTELTYKVEGFTDRGNRPSFLQATVILPQGVEIDRNKIKTAFDNATKEIKSSRGGIKLINISPIQERDLLNSVIDSLKPSDINEIIQQLRDFDFTNDQINKVLKEEGYTKLDNYLESQAKRKQIVIGENADLKQNVKDFILQANEMEAQGESREDIRLATGWERGADNKWGYELNDVIDIDVKNIEKNKTYDIQDVVAFQELFDAYPDSKKLKVRFIDNPRKSGMAAYYAKKGLIEVNLSKVGLSEYIEDMMAQSRLAKDNKVLKAALLDAKLLNIEQKLEKQGVKRNSDIWIKETENIYPSSQRIIDNKLINDYRIKNNISFQEYFKDVRSIQRLINNAKNLDTAKGIDELNSKLLHELQHAVADLAGLPKGGSAQTIINTFTSKEKSEYNEIVKNINKIKKLKNQGNATQEQLDEAEYEEVKYRYKKYEELAGETMSRNVEARRKLSPQERREKTLESTMDVDIQDQKLLYEEEKNISIKDKKVEEKKKPEERRGIFDMFKKRKQKGDANMEEAIQRALMKFELSAERGNTRSQAIKSAIADLRKNDWYKSATDIQRDEAVRDIKENFGIKSKKGPSTRKVLGQQKRTKITVTLDQMAEYKKQIKEWNRSARLAKKDLNTRRKELGALVKSMVKGGIMTSKQAAILVERASKINLENEVIVNRFVEYAQKVFENAEYAQKFQEAISLRRKIKKNLRRDNQAEVIAMGKKFADIDPQMVEDIDAYIEYADQMYEALRASRIKGLEVDFSQAANLAEMSDFYDEAIANQNKILKKEMIAKYQDLGLTEDMSIEEIREIVNAIEGNEVVEGKEKEIMSFIQKRFGVMTAIAKDMIGRGVNPFTGESIDITEHQKDMIKRMIKADISKMDIKNAIKFVEYMDNFITNEITSGLESAISIYEGEMSIVELMKSKVRGRMPKLGFSEAIGEIWNRQLTSLPVLFDRIFQGTNRGLKVMQKIGVQEIMNGKSKKTSAHNKIMQEYSKKFIDGDKSFMNAENVYERGMVAFMSRNIVGTQAEQKVEFERRKKLVAESIETLEKSKNRKERNKAKVYREVYNRLGIMTATDIASIKSKSSAKNLASVNWWTDQWADKYSDLADVSLSVYNTILGTDTNYTPDKYKVLSKRTDISRREVEEAANKTGAFMSGTHIDRNKSGVLMETTRPGALPKGRYVSFDFDIDNFNSMDKALTDIYTASAIQKFYGASQSSDFDEVFGDTAGLIRDRVASYIKKMKGRDEFTGNKEFNKVLNTVAKFGVSKALGGVSQALKQTFPVIANTLVNAGRFDFAQREDLAWVNESMMSIANRGLEAETAIDSADSKIDVNTSDTLRSIGKKIDSLQGMYLKAFLQAPDVYVAKSSFISYYKQYMKRKGLSTELNQGEYNQDALEYAQMMVDRQQNISDNDLAGEFLSGSRYAMYRKVVAPFASFVLNQKARMMADLRVLNPANKAVTNEDRKAAAKSLTGLMVELTVFHTMSAAIREVFKMAAKGLFGDDDDDDKEEDKWGSLESNKKIWAAGKYAMSSVIKDILSPFPFGGDIVVDKGINELIDKFDINLADEDDVKKAVDAENEIRLLNREDPMSKKEISELRKSIMEQGEIKVWEDDAILKDLGVLSIGVNTVRDLDDAYNFYKDGYYVDDRGGKEKKRYILDRDKEDLGFVVFGKLLTAIGLAPKDVGDISRYGLKEFKKETISEEKYEKYTEIKKEIKREPTDGELYLILNSGQDVKNVVSDIKMLKKHFGGLNEKQAKEYLKLREYKLSQSKFKIEEILKGKTAEQIKKERRDRIEKTGDPVMRF